MGFLGFLLKLMKIYEFLDNFVLFFIKIYMLIIYIINYTS